MSPSDIITMPYLALQVGDTIRNLYAVPYPEYKDMYVDISESNDLNFWDIGSNSIKAKKNGNTKIKLETVSNITKEIDTVIGQQIYDPSDFSYNQRSISDIYIVNPPSILTVGQEYAVEAIGISSSGPFWNATEDPNSFTFETLTPDICSVKFGVVTALKEGEGKIKIKDLNSDLSKTISITVMVPDKWWENMDESLTYSPNVVAASYSGFQTAINYAKDNGYKKLVFPSQEYIIDPKESPISIPSNICLDFNGSIIKMKKDNSFVQNTTAYTLFDISSKDNVILINGHIYGENVWESSDENPYKYHNEHELLIHIHGNCTGCKMINMDVSYGPGFTVTIEHERTSLWNIFKLTDIEAGDLNDNGEPISGDQVYRTKSYKEINIGDENGYVSFGNFQGYSLYKLYARLISVYWFDESHTLLRKDKYVRQYAFYTPPEGVKYVKITVKQPNAPDYADPDFGGFLHMIPYKRCFGTEVINCTFKRSVSTAILAWGDGTIVDNCVFEECGFLDPASSIDWEDYGYMQHSVIVRNCKFIKGKAVGSLISNASSSLVFHDNIFDGVPIDIRSETEFFRMYHNICRSQIKLSSKYDSVFAGNILSSDPVIGTINNNLQIFRADNFKLIDYNKELPF